MHKHVLFLQNEQLEHELREKPVEPLLLLPVGGSTWLKAWCAEHEVVSVYFASFSICADPK